MSLTGNAGEPRSGGAGPAFVPAIVAAIAALALYAVTLGGVYIYDDIQIVTVDKRVRNPHLWGQFWTHDYWNEPRGISVDNLYRPLVSMSYGLQWWLHGNAPWAFHLVNVLLHAITCTLVAELGRRIAGWRAGLIAGLLFAVHPVHVEAVAGIVGRADLMCTASIVGALILFLHRPMTMPRALGIFILCIVGLLSKEQGMLLPALLLVLDPVRRNLKLAASGEAIVAAPGPPLDYASPTTKKPAKNQAMLWLIVLVTWSVAGLIVLREEVLGLRFEWDRSFLAWEIQPLITASDVDRLLIPFALIGRYLGLLIAPVHLSLDYGVAVIGASISRNDFFLWLGFATVLVWLIATIICWWKRQWTALFCLLATALSYSMVSNFIIIGTIFGERLLYLPSVFLLILAGIALAKLPRRVLIPAMVLLVVLGSARSFAYARHWNNRQAFYEYTLQQQPRSVKAHWLVGQVALEQNRLEDAKVAFAGALAIAPEDWECWQNCGIVEEAMGHWKTAEDFYQHAFDMKPKAMLLQKIRAMHHKAATQAASRPSTRR